MRRNSKSGTAHVVQKGMKRTSWLATPSRDFKAALAFADALIVRRGGTVPKCKSYEQYIAEWIAARETA